MPLVANHERNTTKERGVRAQNSRKRLRRRDDSLNIVEVPHFITCRHGTTVRAPRRYSHLIQALHERLTKLGRKRTVRDKKNSYAISSGLSVPIHQRLAERRFTGACWHLKGEAIGSLK